MANLSDDPKVKRIHESEREIACVRAKIETADLHDGHPQEFTAMRTEQERHRQDILKHKTEIDASLREVPCADEHH